MGEAKMLEYLAYTLFLLTMLGCLLFVSHAFENESGSEHEKRD